MFNAQILSFQEFVMNEPLPLSTLQDAILKFLRGRDDTVLFGAQAVNAYVHEKRMTEDVDLISVRADHLSQELKEYLHDLYHIAIRVRRVADGKGFRLFQAKKGGNRHLADIRSVDNLPENQRISQILVLTPIELIASKVISYYRRKGRPKAGTDWRDLALLLLTFPELKTEDGPVTERLHEANVEQNIMDTWTDFVNQEIVLEEDEDEFMDVDW